MFSAYSELLPSDDNRTLLLEASCEGCGKDAVRDHSLDWQLNCVSQ